MGVIMKFNKLIIMTELKTIHFDLPKDVDNNLKRKIDFITKHNEFLTVHKMKTKLVNYCPNINMEAIFMNTKNSKTSEPHKFVFNVLQR